MIHKVPGRLLIDWDFEAKGVWLINEPEGSLGFSDETLTIALRQALADWNRQGEDLFRNGEPAESPEELDRFWRKSADLARRVQDELGSSWQILYSTGNASWTWVVPPYSH